MEVMPTLTVPSPLSRIHSCDAGYLSFSGTSTLPPGCWRARASGARPLRSMRPSVRLPEKLAAPCGRRVYLRRGPRERTFSPECPVPAVLLPESLRGLYSFEIGRAHV